MMEIGNLKTIKGKVALVVDVDFLGEGKLVDEDGNIAFMMPSSFQMALNLIELRYFTS